jgi:DNA-binding XRE family transcriptional regulator
MTIRYERRGLRVVRVEDVAPVVRRPPPAPAPAGPGEEYDVRLHRFALEIRGAVRRYRRSVSWGDTPRTRAPSPVTPEQLKAARTLAGLKQWQLAARLGLSRTQVAEAESGRRYVNTRLGDWAAGVLQGKGGQP